MDNLYRLGAVVISFAEVLHPDYYSLDTNKGQRLATAALALHGLNLEVFAHLIAIEPHAPQLHNWDSMECTFKCASTLGRFAQRRYPQFNLAKPRWVVTLVGPGSNFFRSSPYFCAFEKSTGLGMVQHLARTDIPTPKTPQT